MTDKQFAAPREEQEKAEARDWLVRILRKHAPDCIPAPELVVLCSQIDSLVTGLALSTPSPVSPGTPFAKLKGALVGEESDAVFNEAIDALRPTAAPVSEPGKFMDVELQHESAAPAEGPHVWPCKHAGLPCTCPDDVKLGRLQQVQQRAAPVSEEWRDYVQHKEHCEIAIATWTDHAGSLWDDNAKEWKIAVCTCGLDTLLSVRERGEK